MTKFLELFLFWIFSSVHDKKLGADDYKTAETKTIILCTYFEVLFFVFLSIVFTTFDLNTYLKLGIGIHYLFILTGFGVVGIINDHLLSKGDILVNIYERHVQSSFWFTRSKLYLLIFAILYILILLKLPRCAHINL